MMMYCPVWYHSWFSVALGFASITWLLLPSLWLGSCCYTYIYIFVIKLKCSISILNFCFCFMNCGSIFKGMLHVHFVCRLMSSLVYVWQYDDLECIPIALHMTVALTSLERERERERSYRCLFFLIYIFIQFWISVYIGFIP